MVPSGNQNYIEHVTRVFLTPSICSRNPQAARDKQRVTAVTLKVQMARRVIALNPVLPPPRLSRLPFANDPLTLTYETVR